MMVGTERLTAAQALERLRRGNLEYLAAKRPPARPHQYQAAQRPYAIIVGCSDSRVMPEQLFNADSGELFVIRVAGNVIDDHQLGSIEYAAGHLDCSLVVVLGHTHCGAVDAALNHEPAGYIKYITDEIRLAIGSETDAHAACRLNVRHSVAVIERSLEIQQIEAEQGLAVIGAVYDLESGQVEFLPPE